VNRRGGAEACGAMSSGARMGLDRESDRRTKRLA